VSQEVVTILATYPDMLTRYRNSANHAAIVLDKNNMRSLIFGSAILGGFLFYEALSLALALRIMHILRTNMHLYSERTYKLHMRLTLLLIAQLLAPLVLIGLPVCSAMVMFILGLPVTKQLRQMGIVMLALYASVNSLLILLFVTPFRSSNAVHRTFERI